MLRGSIVCKSDGILVVGFILCKASKILIIIDRYWFNDLIIILSDDVFPFIGRKN